MSAEIHPPRRELSDLAAGPERVLDRTRRQADRSHSPGTMADPSDLPGSADGASRGRWSCWSASLFPQSPTLDNYVRGWQYTGRLTFTTFFTNSAIYAVLATIAGVLSSSFIAYGFARIEFAGRKVTYGLMIATMLIPFQVLMVPQFIIFHKLGWVNTFLPLIVPLLGGFPFFISLMVQFIRGIPLELDNSARIDGCGRFRIYALIIMPLVKPAIFAMGTLSLVPIVVLFLFFQRYIVQGIATTGLK